jgi:L-amino acid N-acyltransferase YncA
MVIWSEQSIICINIYVARLLRSKEREKIMNIQVRAYEEQDISKMTEIWNEVVEEGIAFPQEEILTNQAAAQFFREQTYSAVAVDMRTDEIYGLYILHPNNVGRCGHICNASYAVSSNIRGNHIGEKLVLDCLEQAKSHGFGEETAGKIGFPVRCIFSKKTAQKSGKNVHWFNGVNGRIQSGFFPRHQILSEAG